MTTSPHTQFKNDCATELAAQAADVDLAVSSREWMNRSNARKYSYHFEWLGRPIIQYPQDMVAMQQIIWAVQPELIIETGIAHGGSLILSASMLELNAACAGPSNATVLGIDIDIRAHNRAAIEAHPMGKRIQMLEGSSISPEIIEQVHVAAEGKKSILIFLDSNHTHDHVLAELDAYAKLASLNSYCVVFDTVIEDMPASMFSDRPWGPGNNPKTAVRYWLTSHPEFEVDHALESSLLITVAPGGYLKRVA